MITLIIMFSTFSSISLAASSISGRSSGGADGRANLSGQIWIVRNSTTFFFKDEVAARTTTDSLGTIAVRTVIWFNDGTTEKTNAKEAWDYGTKTSVQAAVKADNHYANKGTAGHVFSSTNRGDWSGGTNINFN